MFKIRKNFLFNHKTFKSCKNFCLVNSNNKDTKTNFDNLKDKNFNFINKIDYNIKEIELNDTITSIMNICQSNKQVSVILADDYSNGKYSYLLALVNKLKSELNYKNENTKKSTIIDEDEIFVNYNTVYETMKKNYNKNKAKVNIKPRGALIVGKKLDFLNKSYKILKMIDNKEFPLRIVRSGNSLQGITYTVENTVN